jgi:hypothetical protein
LSLLKTPFYFAKKSRTSFDVAIADHIVTKTSKEGDVCFSRMVKEVRSLAGDSRPVLETSDDFLSLDSSEKDRLTRVLLNYMGHVLPVGTCIDCGSCLPF